jgi:lysozyme
VTLLPSAACFDLIKRFEGCRLHAYPDPGTGGAPWTIGYGHTGADVHKGTVWTQEQADHALKQDVTAFGYGVWRLVREFKTNQHQFDALVSFAYNAGLRNLETSTLLKNHIGGNYEAAADQFARWVHAGHSVLPGLVKRREAEAELYRGAA